MKFYITEKTKQEIEDKIVELETNIKQFKSIMPTYDTVASNTQLFVFKEILSSATILRVEESWNNISNNTFDRANNSEIYPQGVIIQPK
jgi:archaellum component FlaC